MTNTPELPSVISATLNPAAQGGDRRAPLRWWLLAAAAIVLGASLGVTVARANRTIIVGTSSNIVTSNGGTFTRIPSTPAPAFQLVDLESPQKTVSLNDFRGHFLILNFWASWCPPCRKEMPALASVAHQLAGRVDFVGLDTQDERSAGLAFAKSTNVHYPLAFDTAAVWSSYGVYGLPTTFFISPSGRILGKQVGGLTKPRLLTLIKQVFTGSKSSA